MKRIAYFQKQTAGFIRLYFFNFLLVLLSVNVCLAAFYSGDVAAKNDEQKPEKKSSRRHSQVLSVSLQGRMSAVREDLLNENYTQALEKLNKLLARGDHLKVYDNAKIYEMLLNVYMGLKEYRQASSAAEQALSLAVLEEASVIQLHHRLIYLYFFLEEYPQAIKHLEVWFDIESAPDIQSYFTAAHLYVQTDELEKALNFAVNGLAQLDQYPDRKPKETWYQILIAIYLRLESYQEGATALERAISYWPQQANYYMQLAAIYQKLQRAKESLAILSIAYQNKLLLDESALSRLTQLYRFYDYPYKGASIYKAQMHQGNIKPSEKNWEEVANAWLQARELPQAEAALKQAAKLSDGGGHWLRLCQAAFQEERWQDSQGYCETALEMGDLGKEEGSAWYLLALGRYYQNNIVSAKQAFLRCCDWEETKKACVHWRTYATQILADREQEKERLEQEKIEHEKRKEKQQQAVDQALLLKS